MKNTSKFLAIVMFMAFGLFTAVTSFPQSIQAAPPGNPPTANVSPTFTGLTVTGDTTLKGNIINPLGDVVIHDGLLVDAGTTQLGILNAGVTTLNTLTAAATTLASLNVTGATILSGTTTSTGSLSTGGNLTVTGTSSLQGSISDPNSNVMIGDGLTVSGDTTLQSNLTVGGAGSPTVTTLVGSLNAGATTTTGLTNNGNLSLTGAISTTSAPLEINSDVTIAGHLKATSIGNLYVRNCPGDASCGRTVAGPGSSTGSVPAGSWGETDGYCDSNHIVISCFGGFTAITDSNKQWITTLETATRATNRQGCYLNVQNNTAVARSIMLYVSCYNPNG